MANKCKSYHLQPTTRYTYHPLTGRSIAHDIEVGVCWGTKECDQCNCGGDMSRCDFYPEVRKKALRKKEPKFGEWTSVEDRLPEKNVRVLVYIKSSRSYTRFDTDRLDDRGFVRWFNDVTHWMPLPEAPKKGGAE